MLRSKVEEPQSIFEISSEAKSQTAPSRKVDSLSKGDNGTISVNADHQVTAKSRLRYLIKKSESNKILCRVLREDQEIQCLFRGIVRDSVGEPLLTEKEAIEEALRNGFIINGIEYPRCSKTKNFTRTLDMTEILVNQLCRNINSRSRFDKLLARRIFKTIVVRSSKEGMKEEMQYILSNLFLKNNPNMALSVLCNERGGKDQPVPSISMFASEGRLHVEIRMRALCKITRTKGSAILKRHNKGSIPGNDEALEQRDESNEVSNKSNWSEVLEFISETNELLCFHPGSKFDSVRSLNVLIP